jgi:hypothetical protein
VVLPFSPQFNPNVVSERDGNTFLHILCEAIESRWKNIADDVDIHDVAHPNHELAEQFEFMLSVPNIDVNIRNRTDGHGIIHILKKARPVLKLLLEFEGTDIDLTYDDGAIYGRETAFYRLCRESIRCRSHTETIAMFLEAGCNVNFSLYNNPALNVLVTLRDNLHNLNPVNLRSRQINEVHMRVRRNIDETIFPIIELLLRYGADPNVRANPTQETIFGKIIVHEWPLNMVALFLEYGGNPLLPHTPDAARPRIIDLAENSPQLQAWMMETTTTVIKSLLRRLPMDTRRRVVQESLDYSLD